jgi:hypothetical protein
MSGRLLFKQLALPRHIVFFLVAVVDRLYANPGARQASKHFNMAVAARWCT